MLDITWPELESNMYGAGPVVGVEGQKTSFKFDFFSKLRERLNPKETPEDAIDVTVDALKNVLEAGWDLLTVSNVLMLVEVVLDFVLPKIDFPGPDTVIRPLVKRAIMSTAEPLARNYLGLK